MVRPDCLGDVDGTVGAQYAHEGWRDSFAEADAESLTILTPRLLSAMEDTACSMSPGVSRRFSRRREDAHDRLGRDPLLIT